MENINDQLNSILNMIKEMEKINKVNIDTIKWVIQNKIGLNRIELERQSNSNLPKLPDFAAANFDNIAEISTRLTTGNVSHHARTIEGLAKRNAEFIRKHYC